MRSPRRPEFGFAVLRLASGLRSFSTPAPVCAGPVGWFWVEPPVLMEVGTGGSFFARTAAADTPACVCRAGSYLPRP